MGWGSSGSLDHHLEPAWKREAGCSLRLGSEGWQEAPGLPRPCTNRQGSPLCRWGDAPAHLACVPGPCVTGAWRPRMQGRACHRLWWHVLLRP